MQAGTDDSPEPDAGPAHRDPGPLQRAAFGQATVGIGLLDLGTGRMLDANRAFLAALDRTIEEVKGTAFAALLPAAEGAPGGARRVLRKDGSGIDLEVDIRDLGPRAAGIACVTIQDASAAKQSGSERVRLLEILQATSDFVGMADEAGRVVYANRAMTRLRGADADAPAPSIADYHPPWAAELVLKVGLPTARERGIWRGETALLDPQGNEIPVSQVIVAHRGESGQPECYSTIARDITEQKHAEHHLWTLLKNYQDLKFAVDESTIFAVTDRDGRILDVNERFCQVAGYSREEMLGQDHRMLNSGHHPKAFFKDLWDTIKAGRVWRGEIRNRAKDGAIYWVDATLVPWLGADGRPERFIALRTVITDRKLAEERLRTREAQLEVLLRTSRDLNMDLEIPAVFRKLVRSALQLAGARSGAAGLHRDGKVRFSEYWTGAEWVPVDFHFGPGEGVPGHVLETGEPYIANDAANDPKVLPEVQRELGFRNLVDVPILDRSGGFLGCFEIHDTLDGRPFGEQDLWVLRGLADAAAVALNNARMLAERERDEAVLRHVQKVESLGVLAGGIAHDFNNLLAIISGNVAMAQLHGREGAEDPFLASIDDAVQRAADLTRQLMTYAGKGRSDSVALDLNRTVEAMAKLLAVSCSKKAELETHLEADLPFILADPAQVQQVVMNLVINASDALEGRTGSIRVATGIRDIAYGDRLLDTQREPLPPGRYVTLTVSDSGCGMSAEIQTRIWDPFFSTKATGRGLGLSAMQGILRSHGARIHLASAPGAGSTFTVYFKPGEGTHQDAAAGDAKVAWQGHGRLLLVDDEAEVRHAIAPLLRRLGFEVVEAAHGREAVARYQREGPFRLVLMDLSMPQMDGLEAFREIRSLDPAARVILLSGYDPKGSIGPAEGINGFLQKPFRLDRLKEILRKVLDGA